MPLICESAWWRGGEQLVALVVSVLYRGSALPVAWVILPGNAPGPWLGPDPTTQDRLK